MRHRDLVKALRIVNLSSQIFSQWSKEEGNLKQALIASERALLWSWHRIQLEKEDDRKKYFDEFGASRDLPGRRRSSSQSGGRAIWTRLIGKKVVLPFINRAIPIIEDEAIDKEFGTGMVKVTPAHDPVDFEISERHHLPVIHILNPDATMNDNAGPYAGLHRFEARKKVVQDFEKAGLMEHN